MHQPKQTNDRERVHLKYIDRDSDLSPSTEFGCGIFGVGGLCVRIGGVCRSWSPSRARSRGVREVNKRFSTVTSSLPESLDDDDGQTACLAADSPPKARKTVAVDGSARFMTDV
ncbi:hypothetical protein GWI33_016489 [Rhynchophorus ferrugineus]|uniref:Uncharacterized protein n=1 Tax=Rhynchophorus ferrugineus TaxID=354439 RepID=A0A834HXW1_RHYFE|nr:hypothetical protein GWI33_016489 [Rhynchophorus ferrugineus]